jgi:hypothetical protein
MAKQESNGKFTVTMSAAEYRTYKKLFTHEGTRMLHEISKEVEAERVVMLDMKNQVAKLKPILTSMQFKADANKTFVKMVSGNPAIVETGDTGLVKGISYITNDIELQPHEQVQLKALDEIAYEMKLDGNLEKPTVTRQFYELKNMMANKPVEYMDLALTGERNPEQTARMNEIDFQLSVEGKRNIQANIQRMETEIHNAEVNLGYKNEPLQQTGE